MHTNEETGVWATGTATVGHGPVEAAVDAGSTGAATNTEVLPRGSGASECDAATSVSCCWPR
jgi:hypothetical protein